MFSNTPLLHLTKTAIRAILSALAHGVLKIPPAAGKDQG
jgi:hypothetical protein